MNQPNKRRSRRPSTGWAAWQLTIAYISNYHSPDAILKLQVTPESDGGLCWSSSLTWGQHGESIDCQPLFSTITSAIVATGRSFSLYI